MKISDFMKNDFREYALYTLEQRAIPGFDGMKPVQRFLLYQGMNTSARSEFVKTASLGSSVSAVGYEHGEGSSTEALVNMSTEFGNNLRLFLSDGNFGNKLDHTASAARYIFSKLNPIVDKLFLDTELAPVHKDKEHIPPKFYLPIIPYVLCNGIQGIATGFATNIPPFNPKDLIENMRLLAKGKKQKDIIPYYPMFLGEVYRDPAAPSVIIRRGVFERIGKKKLLISELTPGMEIDSYKKILNKLVDNRTITSYVDDSSDNQVHIELNLVDGDMSDDKIFKVLKLEDKFIPNFTVINENDKLKEYDKETGALDITEDFYNYRIQKVEEGRLLRIDKAKKQLAYAECYLKLCEDVIKKKFDFVKQVNDDTLLNTLETQYKFSEEDAKRVSNTALRSFTQASIDLTKKRIKTLEDLISKLESQTKEDVLLEELDALEKALAKQVQDA